MVWGTGVLAVGMIAGLWLGSRRPSARCWHHDIAGGWQSGRGDSWVKGQLIDTGMRKMLWCTKCGRTEFI